MSLARHTDFSRLSPSKEFIQLRTYPNIECISAHYYAGLLLTADAIILALSGLLPAFTYDPIVPTDFRQYIFAVAIALLIFLLSSQALGLYATEQIFVLRRLISGGVLSVLLTFSVLMMAGIATKVSEEYSRVWFFSWFALSMTLVASVRVWLLAAAEAQLARGACLQRAFIITCGEHKLSGEQIALETRNRVRAIGAISVQDLASLPDLSPYLRQLRPEIIILGIPWSEVDCLMSKLKVLSEQAVEVLVLPQANSDLQKVLRLRRLGSQTLLQIEEPPLAEWDRVVKRFEDIVVAILGLIIATPFLILVAIAIKLESRGPILFKQTRVGFNGSLIEVWKFRSMYIDGADLHASRQTSRDDPRVTRVGRFIRRTSIDELPQFWNVLQGQMSVVGPRPHALKTSAEGEALEALVDEYVSRHRVKPGITGWAQINGARGELYSREQVKKRVDYDLHYIKHWSVLFDIKIILMTIMRVLHDSKAY